jgi:hypothetical protein
MKTTFRFPAITAAVVLISALTLHANPALVGNKALAGQALDADGVKAVLLGKKATLGSDRVIIVIVKSSDSQEAFLKENVGMTTDQFQTHWRRLFMSGGGSAPKVVDNEDEARKLVAQTAGAITVTDSAKAEDLPVLFPK